MRLFVLMGREIWPERRQKSLGMALEESVNQVWEKGIEMETTVLEPE